jgi:endonuclease/exonuclease/phosphatase family metal-dependent hydrolase
MPTRFRLFTKRFFIYTHIAVVFFFLLSCLVPLLNPQKWWWITFLGLGFSVLLVLVIFFMFFWFIIKPKYAWISVIALLIAFKNINVFFAFNSPGTFTYKKGADTIRIASWNVARFVEMKRNNNKGSQTRLKMMDLIGQQNADILCFQEFFNSLNPEWYQNIDYIKQYYHYPYHFYSHDVDGDAHFTGTIIFSRYPIIDSGLVRYPRPTLPEALMHADIKINDDTIRVFSTHLQSFELGKDEYRKIDGLTKGDSFIDNSKSILSKLRHGSALRSIQAGVVKTLIADSPYPVLFAGDLNDVPNSFTYFTVKGDMKDAFIKKGFGIGRTFSGLAPTLRIDYIFADNDFKIIQFNRLVKNLSDHYMVVADVKLSANRKRKD